MAGGIAGVRRYQVGMGSASAIHAAPDVSLGIRQSPRGDSEPPDPVIL